MTASLRLSSDEERAVAAFLENDVDTPRSSPRELLAAFCAHADADTAAVDAWRRRFPGWSAEQIRSALLFDNP